MVQVVEYAGEPVAVELTEDDERHVRVAGLDQHFVSRPDPQLRDRIRCLVHRLHPPTS